MTTRTWVLDCDGVLWRGDSAIPGAGAFIDRVRANGDALLFCTNNAARTQAHLVAKARRLLGVEVEEAEVITSAIVSGDVLAARGARSALVLGMDGLRAAVEDVGIEVVDTGPADAVVVGLDLDVDYGRIKEAANVVRSGGWFLASNTDATYPVPGGAWPGAGTIVAAVATAGGRPPDAIAGKPHDPMVEAVRRRATGEVTVVGDRPETDLALARAGGWESVGVLTGVVAHVDEIPSELAPDRLVASIADLIDVV
ncbi:MAG: HAD-IIA family hydrolase [Acidimicrobiia bacterium]|nr:HAD-IIA family hydrolase [Acidimicrobiia bacterium]